MTASRMFYRLLSAVGAALLVLLLNVPGRAAQEQSLVRNTAQFDHIRLQGAFTTTVRAGTRAARVTITAEPDVLRRITSRVEGSTLVVGMLDGNVIGRRMPKIDITVPVLSGFSEEGTGGSTIRGLSGGDLSLALDGAGSIVASGKAAHEAITLNGTGSIDATGVDARAATVDNSGVGSVRVRASDLLTASVSGVGSIGYTGSVTNVQSHVDGIGSIHRL